jgi:hypothetical protein
MNPTIIAGILRAIVPAIIAYAAAKGWDLSSLGTDAALGGLAALIAAAWSVQAKKKPATATEPETLSK